jgi:uncharacterized membrane protein HdeD (DUF308 family)
MSGVARAVESGGKDMTAFGVIAIILGMLAMLAPGITGLSLAILLGLVVLAGGIIRMIWAFQAGSLGKGILKFAVGLLTVVAGIVLVTNPIVGSGVLTILLAVYFILDGVSEIAAGVGLGVGTGGGWLLFGGIVSVLLGFMIWAQFPLSGAWALGTLLGIKLFFIGLIMITGGSAARAIARA